jgi:hypothetical protein
LANKNNYIFFRVKKKAGEPWLKVNPPSALNADQHEFLVWRKITDFPLGCQEGQRGRGRERRKTRGYRRGDG